MQAVDGPPAHEVPIEQARAGHEAESEHLSGPGEPVAEVRDLTIPSPNGEIPVRVYRPSGADGAAGTRGLVAYIHGGGWMVGTIDSFDTVVRALTNAAGAVVVSIGYRLAPEHPFPAGLEDALCAVRWIAANARALGGDPQRLAIAGDSAGANLATVVARRLRGEVDFRLQTLVYPVTDAGVNTPSYRTFGERYGLTAASMQRFWNLYLDGGDGLDPDASPLRADDLEDSPPAFILTAEADPLRDEGEAYADALRDAGVAVRQTRYEGAIHGFWRWLAATSLSRRAVDEVAAALREALA
jgi:acetyl esterase